jgi:N-acetylmuramoyl-L-alanine amidase
MEREKVKGNEPMSDFRAPVGQRTRSWLNTAPVLVLSLTAFVAVVALGAPVARTPAIAAEADAFAGLVCFFQDAHLVCIERCGASASTDTVTPEAPLYALLTGPTPDERIRGIESALPPGTQLVSVQAEDQSITVRLAFPTGFLNTGSKSRAQESVSVSSANLDFLTSEAIMEQIVQTLFPLGYRDFQVEAQDPSAPEVFRPLSAYLPPITVSPKKEAAEASVSEADSRPRPASQPPVEVLGRPQGALTGKTVYVSSGHGWQWTGSAWRTQRPPYPDSSMGYVGPIIEDHNNAEVVNQYLLRYLWNAGADVWTARERDMNPIEYIVDNESAGFSTSGAWGTIDTGGYANRYVQAAADSGGSASATWTFDPVPSDGVYGLYVWYVPGPDRASDAHYTVQHAGGATELTVDQLHHGSTWRYVGRFPVRAGERLVVTLNSRSATPGRVVVADAVRLGGGWFDNSDLASNGGPVETDAPYGADEPWWEVAAYYNVQRMGIDPDDFSYFNDVVARPMWARWEHANTGDDAVYISWHTNGYNGHNTTTRGTVSYIHSSQAVAGSADLRHAIHSELINDIRAGWDPSWVDLGEASSDLGELRELWDSNASNAIRGVLVEIAYHDHATDTDALKDPRFALLSARAVYQGIVKYYGVDLPLLPEPPTHLVVRNDGPGQIRVSWRPSPVDGIDLVGDSAERYRVYTSPDGLGWDNGREVFGTETKLTGLQENELIFVRVTAINAGGESFPTPVLAARSGADGVARILVVDGFDRIDRQGLIMENDPIYGINARLFPDQINSYDYVIQHGENIELPFDSAVNEAVADGSLVLSSYGAIDWVLGEESTTDHTFDPTEQGIVSAYLEGGGALFVSGSEIGWDLVTHGNGPEFYRNYLVADLAGDDAGTYQAKPTNEGIFAGLGTIEFREGYDVDSPDQLTPRLGSTAALNYLGGMGGTAAVQYEGGGCRRVVHMGFPYETIAAAQRPAVMARVIDFLSASGCLSRGPETTITTPPNGAAYNTVPSFGGTAEGVNPIERVEVQIIDPDGRYWDGQTWTQEPRWLTAIGTTDWHYPLPSSAMNEIPQSASLIQGEYDLWARAWDTAVLSDTTPAFASFIYDTIPPKAPTLVAPVDGITVSPLPLAYFWGSPPDDTGSALSYNLQVDDQVLTVPVTFYAEPIWLANGAHRWRVRAVDAAGNISPWTDFWTFVVEHKDLYFPITFQRAGSGGTSIGSIVTEGHDSHRAQNLTIR